MKKYLTLLLSLGAIAIAQAQNTPNYAALNDVTHLVQAKVSETTIVNFINQSKVDYNLNAEAIIKLKADGATPNEINAMLQSKGAVAQAPAYPAPGQVVQSIPPPAPPAPPVTQVVVVPQPQVMFVQPAPVPWWGVVNVGFVWTSGYHGGYHGGYHH